MDEGFVAREEAMPAGEQVAFEPSLAHMLAEHFHDAAIRTEVIIAREDPGHPGAIGYLKERSEPVRGGFVRPDDAKVARLGVEFHYVAQHVTHDAGCLRHRVAGFGHIHGVGPEVRHDKVLQKLSTIRMWIGAHAAVTLRRQFS